MLDAILCLPTKVNTYSLRLYNMPGTVSDTDAVLSHNDPYKEATSDCIRQSLACYSFQETKKF
jgi:hypothetical protein